MKFYVAAIAASALPVALALRIDTIAGVTTCRPTRLTWGDGTPPYFVSLLPVGQINATPLKDFGEQTGDFLTWNVDLSGGTTVTARVTDSTGASAYSDQIAITGPDAATCSSGSSGGSGPSSTGNTNTAGNTATTPPPGSTSPPSSAPPTTSNTSPRPTSASPTNSNTAASQAPSNAAVAGAPISFTLAGLMGLVGAAVL